MLTARRVAEKMRHERVPFGVDIELSQKLDESGCEEFFGRRCPYGLHATGDRRVHRDRFDPRFKTVCHIEKDAGLPFPVLTGFGGAFVGGLIDRANPIRGAATGGLLGFLVGLFFSCE